MEVPQKIKIELPYDIAFKKKKQKKAIIQKDTCIPVFTEILFIIAKIWKQSKWPLTDE